MTRHAPREGQERAPGLISRIAGTSSLLQPYVPGRRPTAHAHALNLAARSRTTARAADLSTGEFASLLERLSAASELEGALHLLAVELPAALGLERVVIALEAPHIAADSRTLAPGRTVQDAPVTVARVTRPLWLLPRQPAATGDTLEIPIEANRERLGLLRAWVTADDSRPTEALLTPLRIVSVTLGQQILLSRLRTTAPTVGNDTHAALSLGERQRWNALLEYVAHEVKTPLTCIQGHAQLLSRYVRAARAATKTKRGTLAHLLDDCERHLPALEKQVTRIEQLLRDTLDLARSDDGGLPLTRSRVNLTALLTGVARSLEPGLSCRITVEAPETVEVICDAARIEQVSGELVSYVVRGEQDRDVCIHVTAVEDGGARHARIAIGCTRELASDVPDPLDLPASPKTAAIFGTNSAAFPLDLRLALSAAILRQHGGFLRRLSTTAGTSALVLELPLPEIHPAQTGEIHGAPNPRRRR